MLDNCSKEEIDATKISDSSKNVSKNSNSLTIMTKAQNNIHHLAIHKSDKEMKEDIDSLCFNMFSPWELKSLMDVFILAEHQQGYDIINHWNED